MLLEAHGVEAAVLEEVDQVRESTIRTWLRAAGSNITVMIFIGVPASRLTCASGTGNGPVRVIGLCKRKLALVIR